MLQLLGQIFVEKQDANIIKEGILSRISRGAVIMLRIFIFIFEI